MLTVEAIKLWCSYLLQIRRDSSTYATFCLLATIVNMEVPASEKNSNVHLETLEASKIQGVSSLDQPEVQERALKRQLKNRHISMIRLKLHSIETT